MPGVFLAVVATIASAFVTRADTTDYTPRQAAQELPSLVAIDSGRYGFSLELDTTRASGALGALARANRHYVLYLTLNAPAAPGEALGRARTHAEAKQDVLRRLTGDTMYLRVLAESVQRYRASSASRADSEASLSPARAVSLMRLQDIAARFFYPDAVLPDGRIQSHVCVGINGIRDMQGGRDLELEAFVYAAIFHDLLVPKFYVDADFQEASRLINAMDLSSEPATRLQRAQGVMWGAMLRSEKLRQALLAEYQRAHTYLPFQVTNMPADRREASRP